MTSLKLLIWCNILALLNSGTVYPPISGGGRSRCWHVSELHPLGIGFSFKTYRPSSTKDVTRKDPPLIRGPLIGEYTEMQAAREDFVQILGTVWSFRFLGLIGGGFSTLLPLRAVPKSRRACAVTIQWNKKIVGLTSWSWESWGWAQQSARILVIILDLRFGGNAWTNLGTQFLWSVIASRCFFCCILCRILRASASKRKHTAQQF
jgi:hypothetical protein